MEYLLFLFTFLFKLLIAIIKMVTLVAQHVKLKIEDNFMILSNNYRVKDSKSPNLLL